MDDDQFDHARPLPRMLRIADALGDDDLEWCEHHATRAMRHVEGATFLRLASDVFLITVRGAQPLHHDRHLESIEDAAGFSEHTWNLVVVGSSDQQLALEVDQDVFEPFALTQGSLIYMNTANRHMVMRGDPEATTALLQVDGIGPDDADAAIARLREVVKSRPGITRI